MIRVVVDTNVFVSAIITKKPSPLLDVYNFIRLDRCIVITSPPLLGELHEVLLRDQIVKLHHLSSIQIQKVIREIAQTSYIVPATTKLEVIKTDPDDDQVLIAAVEGHADYIISGDHHLTDLAVYEGIKILTPSRFLSHLKSMKQS